MTTHADSRTGDLITSAPAEATSERYVYDLSEGNAGMRALLGGKGAGVAEMMRIGVPVPDGLTVTTSACVASMRNDGTWPEELWAEIQAHLDALERRTGRTLGAAERPLLVSVRSGAVRSMPGMMDTILNLGISDAAADGLAAESGDPRFAWDSYRRFVQMYGEVVEGVPGQVFPAVPGSRRRGGTRSAAAPDSLPGIYGMLVRVVGTVRRGACSGLGLFPSRMSICGKPSSDRALRRS
jgi:pyruvate,orthophosphate dikinase